MKKLSLLFLLLVTILSCGDDLEFNTPSFQSFKDDVAWKAEDFRANVDAFGFLNITGVKGDEIVSLSTAGSSVGVYNIGNVASKAVFRDEFETVYSTNSVPDPSIQLYPSEGNIIIEEFNIVEKTVTGTFYFHAFDNTGLNSVVMNRGFFYNVPITSIATFDDGQQSIACQLAQATTATTLTNLNAVDPNGPQYPQFCNSYKIALQNEINLCGDDGTLQNIINNLGDCSN